MSSGWNFTWRYFLKILDCITPIHWWFTIILSARVGNNQSKLPLHFQHYSIRILHWRNKWSYFLVNYFHTHLSPSAVPSGRISRIRPKFHSSSLQVTCWRFWRVTVYASSSYSQQQSSAACIYLWRSVPPLHRIWLTQMWRKTNKTNHWKCRNRVWRIMRNG